MPRGDPSNKRYSYTSVTILRHGSAPAHLCMVTMHPDQATFLVRGQMQSLLAPANISDSAFQRLVGRTSHASYFQANQAMMLKLKARHAVKPQASHAQLLSTTTCKNMLQALGVDNSTLDSLIALKPVLPNSILITVTPASSTTPSMYSTQHSVSLPALLPSVKYTPAQITKRYGLKTNFQSAALLELEPLQSQLAAFKAWMTQPINLARGQQRYISITTWMKGFDTIISMYLGFCHHVMSVAQPSLEHFLDGNLFAAYTDFLMQRVSTMLLSPFAVCSCCCHGQLWRCMC